MAIIAMRTLFVGQASPQNVVMLTRMGRRGWGSYSADNLKEASGLIQGGSFDLVLASEWLPDGNAYELSAAIMERRSSLFVEIELFIGKIWIPVIERGEKVFGNRAIRMDQIEADLEQVLLAAADEAGGDSGWKSVRATHRPMELGFEPLAISLGPIGGGTASEPTRKPRPSSIAQLQLRCASYGLLRSTSREGGGKRPNKTARRGNEAQFVQPMQRTLGMRSRKRFH